MLYFVILSTYAFGLHFIWENIQCRMFFVHGTYETGVLAMAVASAGDVLLTWVIYSVVALVFREWRWARHGWGRTQATVVLVAALIVGEGIESHALKTGRWAYNEHMPIVPGIGVGLVPLLQLVLLTPSIIALTERTFDRLQRSKKHRS